MDPERKWTAKDDMEALLCCIEKYEGPEPPKADSRKLTDIENHIRQVNSRISAIYERPVFSKKHLTQDEWNRMLEGYETELDHILQKSDPIPALAELEKWFFSFYPPPPRVNTVEGVEAWREQYILFAERRHSDLIPFPFRKEVSVQTLLDEEWKQEYIREIIKISKKVTIFREITIVNLDIAPRKMVIL